MKYVDLEEKGKRSSGATLRGIEIARDKKEITVVAIRTDHEEKTIIKQRTFTLKDFLVQPVEKEDVDHAFKKTIINLENIVNDATFALMDAEKELKDSKAAYKKQFGKDFKP